MLDFFAIFGKGGIVLWALKETQQAIGPPVNALIREVFLQVVLLPIYYFLCVIFFSLRFRIYVLNYVERGSVQT